MKYSLTIFTLLVLVGNSSSALATDTDTDTDVDTAGSVEESDTGEGGSDGKPMDTESESSSPKEPKMDVGTSEVESSIGKTEATTDDATEVTETAEELSTSKTGADASNDDEPAAAGTDEKDAEKVTKSPVDMTKKEALSASSSEAATSHEAQSGPLPPQKISLSARRSYALAVAKYDREYRKHRLMQVMGQSLLVASFAFEIIGTVLIEVASYGGIGWSGFSLVGVGLAHFVASAFLLGFSKPAHHLTPPPNIYERRIAGRYSPELLVIL